MPIFQFPAESMIGAEKVGGRFASMAQMRVTRYPNGSTYATRFPGIIAGLQLRCNVASRESAERIAEDANRRAPTGEDHDDADGLPLHESYYVIDLDMTNDFAVATDTRYAPYVEFGSAHYFPGYPHLMPAVEAGRDPFINDTVEVLQAL